MKLIAEIAPMTEAHHAGASSGPFRGAKLDPNLSAFCGLENNGSLRIFTARKSFPDNPALLVGYAFFYVTGHFLYAEKTAHPLMLFVEASERKGMDGYMFIKFCDEELKREHVTVVTHNVSELHDYAPLLRRLGYEPLEHVYARRLS